jgi:hypothetical protein
MMSSNTISESVECKLGRLKLHKTLVDSIDLKLGHRPLW